MISFKDKVVLVTAGATRECIDPVRYITNHSSGKMGYAMVQALIEAGAQVILISGITDIKHPQEVLHFEQVKSAIDMYNSVMAIIDKIDIFVACAAVADYRVSNSSAVKIKKTSDVLEIKLVKNPDILKAVSKHHPHIFTVGFAAETNNLLENARDKLEKKELDVVIANSVAQEDSAFYNNDNEVNVITNDDNIHLPRASKLEIARQICQTIEKMNEG